MQNLNDLYFFAQVIEYGGFSSAERALGIPKSKLSRRLAALEEELGVRLIQRSPHRFTITDVGQRYYEHCRAMLVEADAAQEMIDTLKAEPKGIIRITCPVGLLNFHIADMLADFMAKYPQITVHLESTNRRVDVLAEGIDIALRVRPLPLEDSDLILRVLSDRGQRLVAAPSLLRQLGTPDTPDDLQRFPSLSRGTPVEQHTWFLIGPQDETRTIKHSPRYVTTDMHALHKAALAGIGMVQLPLLMVNKDLDRKTLVTLLPEWSPRREVIHVVFPSRRGQLPSVRTLIDYLVDRYAAFDED